MTISTNLPADMVSRMIPSIRSSAPRPIGWISSVDREGRRNLAPYSFFNAFNYHPPIVGFCSVGYKDSVRKRRGDRSVRLEPRDASLGPSHERLLRGRGAGCR